MINFIMNNLICSVLYFFIGCFILYLVGRLLSAGWYKSKQKAREDMMKYSEIKKEVDNERI